MAGPRRRRRRRQAKPAVPGAVRLGVDMLETGMAAGMVIASRSALIGAAMLDPRRTGRRELTRMVSEKVEASMLAGGAAARAARAGAASPRSPSIGAYVGLAAAMLAPFHRRATANARRLSRRKPK